MGNYGLAWVHADHDRDPVLARPSGAAGVNVQTLGWGSVRLRALLSPTPPSPRSPLYTLCFIYVLVQCCIQRIHLRVMQHVRESRMTKRPLQADNYVYCCAGRVSAAVWIPSDTNTDAHTDAHETLRALHERIEGRGAWLGLATGFANIVYTEYSTHEATTRAC